METKKTTTTEKRPNPNWWRSIITCVIAAYLMMIGFDFPFIKTFVALMLIYVMHVLLAEKEMRAGVATVWKGLKFAGMVLAGLVIYLALRFLAGKLTGVYPVDSYNALSSGGVPSILGGRDTSNVLLYELVFLLVAGGITSDYVRGKGKFVVQTTLVVSLALLILKLGLPKAKIWPSREETTTNVDNHGAAGGPIVTTWRFLWGRPKPAPPQAPVAVAPSPVVTEFLRSGKGHATSANGLNAWLDPSRTYVRPSQSARYVFVEDNNLYFDDIGPGIGANKEEWFKMPAGEYKVYPLKTDQIYFSWWQ